MPLDITIKNYRCFSDSDPVTISIRDGFTAFVGVNNSGKSSLLKFFYEFRDLFRRLSRRANLAAASNGGFNSFTRATSVSDDGEMFCNTNDRDMEMVFAFPEYAPRILAKKDICVGVVVAVVRGTTSWRIKAVHGLGEGQKFSIIETDGQNTLPLIFEEIAREFVALSNTMYLGSFRNAINVGSNQEYFDMQVGQAFIEQWRAYKTGSVRQQNEDAYRLTEDIRRIFAFDDLEINSADSEGTLQVFADAKSYRLNELGSGLAQFIIVLANVAIQKPSFVLIDEPELNLHPSLQLDFLTTIGSYARSGTLFGTHSIGLARAAADLVYSVQKIGARSKISPLESTTNPSEFLGELSFSGYRELGFDRILLVEGAKEVRTVQQFLRHLHKDHQIVMLPLGGSQLINENAAAELEEIKRIPPNISALIDSEKDSLDAQLDPVRSGFTEVCKDAGIDCHVLVRRAIENYFSESAIRKVFGKKYRSLNPYELLKGATLGWSKTDNWRIAREMDFDDIKDTDLGKFLESL